MVDVGTALRWYKRKDVQEVLVAQAADKEVVGSYGGKGYALRPDILRFPGDVLAQVQNGVTSFHVSEEIWENPLQLEPTLPKKELSRMRKGWDLVLDIDCKEWQFSQFAAYYIKEALMFTGISSVSVKFSGNHGFHIGVPFGAFPEEINSKKTAELNGRLDGVI